MGLNAAKLYDIEVPAELQLNKAAPRRRRRTRSSSSPLDDDEDVDHDGEHDGRAAEVRPRARRADHQARVRVLVRGLSLDGDVEDRAAIPDAAMRARLHSPDRGPTPAKA